LRISSSGNKVATKNSEKQETRNKNVALLNCKVHNLDSIVQFASLLVANWNTGFLVKTEQKFFRRPWKCNKQLLPTHKIMTQGATHHKIVTLLCGTTMTSHYKI